MKTYDLHYLKLYYDLGSGFLLSLDQAKTPPILNLYSPHNPSRVKTTQNH